ncbi:TetR/AcrR family transcriptional regulator [Kribbella speibonae]|uniref:TetR/AcrR family transcriptional regulator n=1 Tax=Kribbella speibonae TaxID=1572660 RepID=A0A4R0IV96_9ACTN|nr:TetR/AcrR family transcriptional regulator [Kribbella speibonae]TCC36474.1 TetR/AcrR family transcriptional regulator [Kribbella speibonae]
MPRQVDHVRRRREIVEATLNVLSEAGTRGLSFRAVANEMGGSTTLITHYFPTQRELLDEVTTQVLAGWDDDVKKLDAQEQTPAVRLQALLRWLVPLTEQGLKEERNRIHLLAGQLLGEENRAILQATETKIRELIRNHVTGLVPPDEVERTVELLRITTNGLVLSVLEHPDLWPPERQIAILDWLTDSLGIAPAGAHKPRGHVKAGAVSRS